MSGKLLDVAIVSPQKVVFKGTASSVTVPGTKGNFQILIDHTPIFSTTEIGEVKLVNEKGLDQYFAVSNGYIEVSRNSVSIIVDLAMESIEISEDEVIENLKNLKATFNNTEKSKRDKITMQIQYEEAKLKVISYNK